MEEKAKSYRSLIGSLMYIMIATRPDIAYAVSNLSRYVSNPGWLHWRAALHCLRYLKGTADIGITYKRNLQEPLTLIAYADSDWAGNADNRRSQTGGVLFLGGGPISWLSQQQQSCALSSAEAELTALVSTIKEVIWVRRLLEELYIKQNISTTIFGDNNSSQVIAKTGQINKYTKHIFCKDEIDVFKTVILKYINTKLNIADIFTKAVVLIYEFTTLRDYMFNPNYNKNV